MANSDHTLGELNKERIRIESAIEQMLNDFMRQFGVEIDEVEIVQMAAGGIPIRTIKLHVSL